MFFQDSEFVCKCGRCKDVPLKLMARLAQLKVNLETIRETIGAPLEVNSGVRCEEHNKAVGGKANSKHLTGQAADLKPPEGMSAEFLAGVITALIKHGVVADGGLGVYGTFVHYDTGPSRRWRGK